MSRKYPRRSEPSSYITVSHPRYAILLLFSILVTAILLLNSHAQLEPAVAGLKAENLPASRSLQVSGTHPAWQQPLTQRVDAESPTRYDCHSSALAEPASSSVAGEFLLSGTSNVRNFTCWQTKLAYVRSVCKSSTVDFSLSQIQSAREEANFLPWD